LSEAATPLAHQGVEVTIIGPPDTCGIQRIQQFLPKHVIGTSSSSAYCAKT